MKHMWDLRRSYERTEENMLYLRHPYLTVEQSYGSTGLTKGDRYAKLLADTLKITNAKFEERCSSTIADRLNHLKVTEAWD